MRHLVLFLVLFGLPVAALAAALMLAARFGAPSRREAAGGLDPIAAASRGRVSIPLRARAAPARLERTREDLALDVAVIATAAAGVIHAGVTRQHFDEYWLYGIFFATSAVAQLVWSGILLRQPSRLLVGLAAAGNAAVVVLWIVTRTLGVPLGPGAGEVEGAAAADVAATSYEVAAVAACLYLLRRRNRPLSRPPIRAFEVFGAVIILTTALAISLVGHGRD